MKQLTRPFEAGRWRFALRLGLLALLAIPFATFTPQATLASPHAHPMLLELAAQQPDSEVSVIVQKNVADNSVESLVGRLGGQITKDLHIINAFVANLAAKAVPELAVADGVRWISPDAPVTKSVDPTINTANLTNHYIRAIKADRVWNVSPNYLQGQGVAVAVIDSGLTSYNDPDLDNGARVVANVKFATAGNIQTDAFGHGTHVAGIIGGDGDNSNGTYIGVAPKVNLINLRVSDDVGAASTSDVVAAMQWVNDNRTTYNIRVVNISMNSAVAESYHTNPLDAAVEILWFNSVVVVVSAGNNGTATLFPPANDPFVITVGAVDMAGTDSIYDDTIPSFSAYGTTESGFAKPDLVAPGKDIISTLASNYSRIAVDHPANIVDGNYFKMSGTSMAAPMVSGAVALLLQDEPNLTPDQVKYRLKSTAVKSTYTWRAYNSTKAGAGYLDVQAAINGTTTQSANTSIQASQLLWTGGEPITWGSVNWNSVNWNSVNWNSVNWNSVNWNSDYWGRR